MRSVRYWKTFKIDGECFSMELVPPQTYSGGDHFDAVVATLKQNGFSYVVTETTERVLDGSTQGCGGFPNRSRARIDEIQPTN